MDVTIILEYISPIILFACLIVGYIIKNIVPTEKINKFIPLIVAVLGIILNVWALGLFDLPTIVMGAMSGLASTGLYEVFDQLIRQLPQKVFSNKE